MRELLTPVVRVQSDHFPDTWIEWERPEFDRCTTHGIVLAGIVHAVGPAVRDIAIGSLWHQFPDDLAATEKPIIEPCYPKEES